MGFNKDKGRKGPPNAAAVEAVRKNADQGEISCRALFRIAEELGIEPGEAGAAADELKVRIVRCRLGLFGYGEQKKIVKADTDAAPELLAAIREQTRDGRIPCKEAWAVAERFSLAKLAVSNACEGAGIRVKPCQLGAF